MKIFYTVVHTILHELLTCIIYIKCCFYSCCYILCMNVILVAGHVKSWVAPFAIDLVILGRLQYLVSSGPKAGG